MHNEDSPPHVLAAPEHKFASIRFLVQEPTYQPSPHFRPLPPREPSLPQAPSPRPFPPEICSRPGSLIFPKNAPRSNREDFPGKNELHRSAPQALVAEVVAEVAELGHSPTAPRWVVLAFVLLSSLSLAAAINYSGLPPSPQWQPISAFTKPVAQKSKSLYDSAIDLFVDIPRDLTRQTDGAAIVGHMTSPSCKPRQSSLQSVKRAFRQDAIVALPPATVLDSGLNCWPFDNGSGHITIQLSRPARLTHVVVNHDPLRPLIAPRNMSLSAVDFGGDLVVLAEFRFDVEGSNHTQSFAVNQTALRVKVDRVTFSVLNNWGGDFTCLYGLRVFGR